MSQMPILSLAFLLAMAETSLPAGENLVSWVAVPLLAILALGLLILCFLKPVVGKFLGKIVAVVAMGLGVGLLVWGILAMARGDQPPTGPLQGVSYSLVIGSGAGFLTSGIVALVLACMIRLPGVAVPQSPVQNGTSSAATQPSSAKAGFSDTRPE